MDEDQVAFVAKLREKTSLDAYSPTLQLLERRDKFASDPLAIGRRATPPRLPVEAEELMQNRRTFKRKWNRGKIGQLEHLASVMNQVNRSREDS